jgi:pyruvate/2-oxoglutarate dehydrogenase complex dihydrolipoamide acyltransferase (E2) component
MRQAQTALATLDRQHKRVLDMIDRAESLVDRGWTTGLMTKPMSALPSDAKALAGVIRSIQANLGLTELQTLKTLGISLGQVTEAEHALVQRLYGELEQTQSAEDVRRTLGDFRRELHAAQRERQAAYERDFGREQAPQGTSARGGSAQTPAAGSGAKVISREQARQLAEKRGISVEQVLQDAAAAGYGIR